MRQMVRALMSNRSRELSLRGGRYVYIVGDVGVIGFYPFY